MTRNWFLPFCLGLLAFTILTAVTFAIFHGLNERNQIESRYESERTSSTLFSSFRKYDDFGSAIEGTQNLKEKILGLGLYDQKGSLLYRWGVVPDAYTPPSFGDAEVAGDMARMYLENPENDSLVLLLQTPRDTPLPLDKDKGSGPRFRPTFVFDTLRKADVIYLEIRQPEFWRKECLLSLSFPLVEMTLGGIIVFVGFLLLKNREYRRRIDKQKNLVALGAVASTLAHENKNPLLASRLHTRIISRTVPDAARRELEIINCEVERLSTLSHQEVERLSTLSRQMNDFLRDPMGSPSPVDIADVAVETSESLCGRSLVTPSPGEFFVVKIDIERLRSILENLIRNALESGGGENGVSIEIGRSRGMILIDVLDRGKGISPQDRQKVFRPFYTTKSHGSGIGLTICRRFVFAAGGSITLEERAGGGTRARILLPEVAS